MTEQKKTAAIDSATNTEVFLEKYGKTIAIAVVAILVILAAWFAYRTFVAQPREKDASTALARGQEYFNMEQWDKALNGDGAGFTGFKRVAEDYGSTDAGNLAHLYAGLCYANLGKWQEAVNELEDFSPKGDAMISPAATNALANAYVHVGKVDEAINKMKDAANEADSKAKDGVNNTIAPYFRLQAGILLESQGKSDEAHQIYQDIKKKYVNSPLVMTSEIDKYIERTTK